MSLLRILSPAEAAPLLTRKDVRMAEAEEIVKPILEAVRTRGDAGVLEYAQKFDGFERESFLIGSDELKGALDSLDVDLREALELASGNIRRFAEAQLPKPFEVEFSPGHWVGQVVRPLETTVGYIPGGRYPLPSTVLMTALPALVAGVENVWISTPKPNATILGAACLAGVSNVVLIGGAQAIAAFAFGTETLPKADRIVGPGNIFVSAAKKLLQGEVGIDFVAGPTEVLVIAEDGNPAWIAADLLAQAEHDTDASSLLLTTSSFLAQAVCAEVSRQLETLATAEIARVAIEKNSAVILCESVDQMIELSNRIAPEHLCLHDETLVSRIRHAGSIFLGGTSPEAAGDYVTGPNHVLPTAGAARTHGGLSVTDYVKIITTQRLSPEALQAIGPAGARIARSEGLEGHARSIEVRL